MSQEDCMRILRQAKEPLTVKQIANLINVGTGSTNANLRRLAKSGEVEIIIRPNTPLRDKYLYKLRTSKLKSKPKQASIIIKETPLYLVLDKKKEKKASNPKRHYLDSKDLDHCILCFKHKQDRNYRTCNDCRLYFRINRIKLKAT